ncbi:MAG: hypothetical protein V4688_00465 [Pseudomonadota bacterium]
MNRLIVPSATLTLMMAASTNAYAYLDPGTGSMLLQSLIGAIAATGMVLSLYWQRVKIAFHNGMEKLKGKKEEPKE